jgi:hypothetical protein
VRVALVDVGVTALARPARGAEADEGVHPVAALLGTLPAARSGGEFRADQNHLIQINRLASYSEPL